MRGITKLLMKHGGFTHNVVQASVLEVKQSPTIVGIRMN
jgi:hypothetical protein